MERYEARPHHDIPYGFVVWDHKTFSVVVTPGTFNSKIKDDSLAKDEAERTARRLNRAYAELYPDRATIVRVAA
jgi:hypothetical protein